MDTTATQEESTPAAPVPTGPLVEDVEMPKAQSSVEEPAPAALDANIVDKKLETIEAEPAAVASSTNGTTETKAETEQTPAVESKAEESIPTPEAAEKAVEEETKIAEKPTEPAPTPAISRLPSTSKPVAPAQPAGPPKPLTWASRAAAAAGPLKPAVPVVAPKISTPPAQNRAAPPTTSAKPAPTQTTTANVPATEKEKETSPQTGGGWQTAGSDHAKRQNRPQSISSPPEKEGTMGYVRNVTEKVQEADLRAALSGYGNLIYFDINRGKVHNFLSVLSLDFQTNTCSRIAPLSNMLARKDIWLLQPLILTRSVVRISMLNPADLKPVLMVVMDTLVRAEASINVAAVDSSKDVLEAKEGEVTLARTVVVVVPHGGDGVRAKPQTHDRIHFYRHSKTSTSTSPLTVFDGVPYLITLKLRLSREQDPMYST